VTIYSISTLQKCGLGKCIVACLFMVASFHSAARPASSTLNDTGQLECLVDEVRTLECAATGQDAEFGRDISKVSDADGRAGFAFARVCNSGATAGKSGCPSEPALGEGPNSWGCTRDLVTGLLWEVKTDDGGLRDKDNLYTNYGDKRSGDTTEFQKIVNSQGLCGHFDWRRPAAHELNSLVDYGAPTAPTIDQAFFPNTVSYASYASATRYSRQQGRHRWAQDFQYGVATQNVLARRIPVRLVHGSYAHSAERYSAVADEVKDNWTGLVWRRCSQGQQWNGKTCMGMPLVLNWADAMEQAHSAQVDGKGWRVPNVKELFTLVDTDASKPAIDESAFPGTFEGLTTYWSSTIAPARFNPTAAWSIDFKYGDMSIWSGQQFFFSVRLVRGSD
jgi:Protein of unknown function (DUF1566)